MADRKYRLIRCEDLIPGVRTFTGVVKFHELPKCTIPWYDTEDDIKDFNYQRQPKETRINAVKDRFLSFRNSTKPDLENMDTKALIDNINLNIRNKTAGLNYVNPLNDTEDCIGGIHEFVYQESLGDMYIVDGQTRYTGLQRAIRESEDRGHGSTADKLRNLHLNITLTFTEKPSLEAFMFYLLNKYNKPLEIEGAERILVLGHNSGDTDFDSEIQLTNSKDFIFAYQVSQKLNEDTSSVWYDMVSDYNDKKTRPIKLGIMAKKVVKPIQSFVERKYGKEQKPQETMDNVTYNYVNTIWQAIREVFPECFESEISEKNVIKMNYNIIKSSSAEALTDFISKILNYYESPNVDKKFDYSDKSAWIRILTPTLTKYVDTNSNGKKVVGSDNWIVGKEGTVGTYTSQGAKKQLAQRLFESFLNNYIGTK
jgi:DGQHR domain-containing protein